MVNLHSESSSLVSDLEAEVLSSEPDNSAILSEVLEGVHAIYDSLQLIILIALVCIAIKLLWMVLDKWFFGGL